jgi:hypothetical protein
MTLLLRKLSPLTLSNLKYLLFFVISTTALFACSSKVMVNKPLNITFDDLMLSTKNAALKEDRVPKNSTSIFLPNDDQVISYIKMRNINGHHEVRFKWIAPDGSEYYTTQVTEIVAEKDKFWFEHVVSHALNIKGDKAESLPGKWTVQFYFDDALITAAHFEIKQNLKSATGAWFVVDDYFDTSPLKLSQRLQEFKDSKHFNYAILNKGGLQAFRMDAIRGANIDKINPATHSKRSTHYMHVGEIATLLKAAPHNTEYKKYTWELNLFLNRMTSGNVDDQTIAAIEEKLKEMNVSKIRVWEFSNLKPGETTIYQKLFDRFNDTFAVEYHIVCSKKQFKDLAIF